MAGLIGAVLLWSLWAYVRRTEIRDPVDGSLYLTRYRLVRLPWCRVFAHRIHRPDKGRDLHNHPWPVALGPGADLARGV